MKVNIDSKSENVNNMENTDTETTGDIAIVEKDENISQAHIKASN